MKKIFFLIFLILFSCSGGDGVSSSETDDNSDNSDTQPTNFTIYQTGNSNIQVTPSGGICLMGGAADRLTTSELKRDVLLYAKGNPEDFLETVNDPMLNLYGDVVQFFNNTWLILKNNGKDVFFNLPKNKNKLLSVPFGEDHYYIVASYFQSDDGVETYKLLSKRLKKDK